MKKYINIFLAATLSLSFAGCREYLTELEPGKTLLSAYYTSTAAAVQNVTACYVPLMWEYDDTYCSEWFIGDIVSDDAIKGGGSTTDMSDVYDMENWRTTDQNTLLKCFYRANYQGIGRCNLALHYIEPIEALDDEWTPEMKARLLGECYYLRAYYYFRLVRVFAGVPVSTKMIESDGDWGIPRSSVDEVYQQILSDLERAESLLPVKSQYTADNLGRTTKGAAQAMLLKVNLYMSSPYWQSYGLTKSAPDCFADAAEWGKKVIDSGEYELVDDYEEQFFIAGENGRESVFEVQYAEVGWGDYGQGFGFTAGSFTQILMRSRSAQIGGGWGFDHPTQNLYDEFEPEDTIRRNVAILVPHDSLIETPSVEYYLGNKMLNNKYGMYRDPADIGGGFGKWSLHASRGPLNNKQIRYADVLLMYAEACLGAGDAATATEYINKVRTRAGLTSIATATDAALRHERRCELAMEGHRWFDLVRWYGANGGLKAHMDAYKATETADAQSHIQEFVAGKHEIFPIPQEERQLNPTEMTQNPGY